MSTKTQFLAAATIVAAFFIASCAGDAEAPQDYAESSADSVMARSPYDQDASTTARNEWKSDAPPSVQKETEAEASNRVDSIGKVLNTSAAGLNRLDSSHLFIRTADVRCRVDEVAGATYRVEDVVKDLGGYVSDTKLSSNQTWQQQTQVTDDSIKQVTRYVVNNTLTIRVPARNLDSLLRALVPLVQYMDYRNVNVNDITLNQLSQQLEQKRIAMYNAMLKEKVIDGNTKAQNIMDAAAAMLARQEQADNAFLESLRLKDQVAYATLTLQLYQPESSVTTMIFHEKPMEPYEAGIGERIADSAYAGWKGFSYLLAGIVLLWPLWLIGATVLIVVRWQMKKRATKAL